KGVYANSEPRHAVASADSDYAERKNDNHLVRGKMRQHAEVDDDDNGDEPFEEQQEFSLLRQVCLASLPNQFRHFLHGTVHGKILQPEVNSQSKKQTQNAEQNSPEQQGMAVHAEKLRASKIGNFQAGLAASALRSLRARRRGKHQKTAGCH